MGEIVELKSVIHKQNTFHLPSIQVCVAAELRSSGFGNQLNGAVSIPFQPNGNSEIKRSYGNQLPPRFGLESFLGPVNGNEMSNSWITPANENQLRSKFHELPKQQQQRFPVPPFPSQALPAFPPGAPHRLPIIPSFITPSPSKFYFLASFGFILQQEVFWK